MVFQKFLIYDCQNPEFNAFENVLLSDVNEGTFDYFFNYSGVLLRTTAVKSLTHVSSVFRFSKHTFLQLCSVNISK